LLLLDWEAEVKDVPVGENAKPIINSVDIYSPADFVDGKIAVTWGKNFEGKINASDLENDVITYGIDATGDNLFLGYKTADTFGINTTKPVSTDATHDLGQLVMKVSDEGGSDTKILGVVGKNPVQATTSLFFNENGTYGIVSDATSDGSFLDKVQLYVNGIFGTESIFNNGYYSVGVDFNNIAIVDGNNTHSVNYSNKALDQRNVVKGFNPASEEEWRIIMRERLADWGGSYNEDYVVDFNAGDNDLCPVGPGTQIQGRVDFWGTDGGNWWSSNYTDNTEDLPTEYDLFQKIKYCRSVETQNKSQQISLDPLYSAESKGKSFVDNGFQVVE
jgi:hypothetical protein